MRYCLIDRKFNVVDFKKINANGYSCKSSTSWLDALDSLFEKISADNKAQIEDICISGTSATVLISDTFNRVTRGPLLYNHNVLEENGGLQAMNFLKTFCPAQSPALAPTSSLAKLVAWSVGNPLLPYERLQHQADYIANSLVQCSNDSPFASDWHNALKLGFDNEALVYPQWLQELLNAVGIGIDCLPVVVEPGKLIGTINATTASLYGITPKCSIVAGLYLSMLSFVLCAG